MPKEDKLSELDLIYLGAAFDMSYGFHGSNPLKAVIISNKGQEDMLLNSMVKKYGGTVKIVPREKGAEIWGWWLTLADRLRLFNLLTSDPDANKYIKSIDVYSHDTYRDRLQRAINSGHE
jgi:hypothetical protein